MFLWLIVGNFFIHFYNLLLTILIDLSETSQIIWRDDVLRMFTNDVYSFLRLCFWKLKHCFESECWQYENDSSNCVSKFRRLQQPQTSPLLTFKTIYVL